jgi:hypothetical protein
METGTTDSEPETIRKSAELSASAAFANTAGSRQAARQTGRPTRIVSFRFKKPVMDMGDSLPLVDI